ATNSKAGMTAAQTACGVGECNTSSTADIGGVDTFCQARAGCSENGTTPTTPDARDLAAGKTEGVSRTTGTCAKDCALTGFASVTEAGSDCQSGNGVCDTNATGRRATDTTLGPAGQTPTAVQAAQASKDNGSATSSAHCQANSVGCDTTTTV